MSAAIIIIDSKGNMRPSGLKEGSIDTVYKRCGFRRADGFVLRHAWPLNSPDGSRVAVYARDHGRAGSENKYDLPPPLDNSLFFGSIALIQLSADGTVENLTMPAWADTYDQLFGGFDDLDTLAEEDENEVDDLDDIEDSKKTKHGYLKDGWIVDDSNTFELEEEEYDD